MTKSAIHRFAVRSRSAFFIFLMVTVACFLAYWIYRFREMAQAISLLREQNVHFRQDSVDESPWFESLPLVRFPAPVRSVSLHSRQNLNEIVPILVRLGTVTELDYYNLSPHELILISKIRSIEIIHASWGGGIEEVRPFLSHKIKEYSVSGADHNLSPDALALLYSLPTLKRVGTAHGESAVPPELRLKRPEIVIYQTDFPP